MTTSSIVKRPKRKYIPENLTIDSWEKLKSFFDELANRTIESSAELEKWLIDGSELSAVMEEDMAWRYIKMNI